MKKNNLLVAIVALWTLTHSIDAYENSFFNNTDIPIGIGIQYTGNDNGKEPLYKQLVKPGMLKSFEPGKINIPAIKWAFCLDNIYYIEQPTSEQKAHNFEKATWKKIPITWIEEKSITKRKSKKEKPRKGFLHNPTTESALSAEKSLCRDRHFDIIRNEQGKIVITSSLRE